ncbi:hypothetical protein [Streptomyces niveus]|uniref:hypothetical protein n=1 Tax=Streptomyces niveus TaxID=193462 RepID=UPI0034431DE3
MGGPRSPFPVTVPLTRHRSGIASELLGLLAQRITHAELSDIGDGPGPPRKQIPSEQTKTWRATMDNRPTEYFQPIISDYGYYAERMVFPDGREGDMRVFTGTAVRDRIDQMTYTDSGEEWVYKDVTQDPHSRIITGVTTTSPDKANHHTATWAPITVGQRDSFEEARAAEWQEFWQAVAAVGL